MVKMYRLALSFIVLVSLSTVTSATLFVDESASTDYTTISGIDWLDLSTTVGLSLTDLQLGYLSNGWDIATASQQQLMMTDNFGVNTTSWWSNVGGHAANFVELFGVTDGNLSSIGYSLHNTGPNPYLAGGCFPWDTNSVVAEMCFASGIPGSYLTSAASIGSFSGKGVFLIRDAVASVPEPSIIALIGLGLIGLVFARRRRQA